MKRILLLVVFYGLWANQSFADLLASEDYILLEKKTAGGYVMPEYEGWESGIIVSVTGSVSAYYRQSRGHQRDYFPLGKLNSVALDTIHHSLAKLPDHDELVFPNTPLCADAPWSIYKAASTYQKIFAKRMQCRDAILKDFSPATRLRKLLDGYEALFQLLRQRI